MSFSVISIVDGHLFKNPSGIAKFLIVNSRIANINGYRLPKLGVKVILNPKPS